MPLVELVKIAGSQTALARTIGASQQIISYWVARQKPLPAEFVLVAEQAFGVSRHALRPDIYPPVHAEASTDSPDAGSPGKADEISGPCDAVREAAE
jgi:DNA-binding transcriptional regulator YdaS (Cro superfamily)